MGTIKISYGGMDSRLGLFIMAASTVGRLTDLSIGLDTADTDAGAEAAFVARLRRRFGPEAVLASDPGAFRTLFRELKAYLRGEPVSIEATLDPGGTTFERRVWAELLRIPRGRVLSYGDVARAVGSPEGARAVGGACGANPIPIIIPCHRVVRSDGSLGGYSAGEGKTGLEIKRALLEIEGVCL